VKYSLRDLSPWSALTVLLAIPVWIMVVRGAVLSRNVDGGIFLSVTDGVSSGLSLYTDIWDNKDPFFFVLMSAASQVNSNLSFFLDLLWIPLASLGVWLLARTVGNVDRSAFLALVVTPFLIVGPFYSAGWTNTPGTALVLFAWGLFARRKFVNAGIVVGLLAFIKLTLFPIGVIGIAILIVMKFNRAPVIRTAVASFITILISGLSLAGLGWLSGFFEAFGKNREYSSDVIVYFGFADSFFGHLSKLQTEWEMRFWVGVFLGLGLIFVGVLSAVAWKRERDFQVLILWSLIAAVGTLGILALTYVWPHHAQAVSLPLILSAVVAAALIPERWWFIGFIAVMLPLTFVLSGWGSWSTLTEHFDVLSVQYDQRVAEIAELPVDARLLNSITTSQFTYARLGTNDDRGFLGDVRPGATLACPYFHLYDFSPAENFVQTLDCIGDVDVILETANFNVFANGINGPNVQPILDYVSTNFNCLQIDDRRLCTRL